VNTEELGRYVRIAKRDATKTEYFVQNYGHVYHLIGKVIVIGKQ